MTVLRWLSALACVVVLGSFLLAIGAVCVSGVTRFNVAFFTMAPEHGMEAGGILPAIVGTALLVLIVTLVTVPIGVLGGIYLSEMAAPRSLTTRVMRWSVSRMAGLPAIVYGLFGLGFFVLGVGHQIDRLFFGGRLVWGQPALIWAGLTMACYTLPVVVVSTESALAGVDEGYRRAAWALGLSRWETIRDVVLPRAARGLLAGALLAVSRAAGEVAPILFAGVAYFRPTLPQGPTDQFMELGYHVFVLATQSPDIERTKPMLFATMTVLLAFTLGLHGAVVAIRLGRRHGAPEYEYAARRRLASREVATTDAPVVQQP